jgi:hypothetical protein
MFVVSAQLHCIPWQYGIAVCAKSCDKQSFSAKQRDMTCIMCGVCRALST